MNVPIEDVYCVAGRGIIAVIRRVDCPSLTLGMTGRVGVVPVRICGIEMYHKLLSPPLPGENIGLVLTPIDHEPEETMQAFRRIAEEKKLWLTLEPT